MKKFLLKVRDALALCVILLLLSIGITWFTGTIHYVGYLVSEDRAIAALQNDGFTNIRVIKRNCSFVQMRGGGKDDDVRFTVEATNSIGKQVTVYVFVGWPWKGATVRTP